MSVAVGYAVISRAANWLPPNSSRRRAVVGVQIHRLPSDGPRGAAVVGIQVDRLPIKRSICVTVVSVGRAAGA